MKTRLMSCICSIALLLSGPVLASKLKWRVYGDLGARYESNPTKAETGDEQDDTKVRALAGISLQQETEFISLDFNYRASRETWVDDTFGERNKLEGYGKFSWKPADYFTFYLKNRREDLIANDTFADTQSNRTVRSVLETGALFTARLGRVDTLNLAPIYRAIKYSDRGVDSNRPGLLLFWDHKLSPTDDFSVNLFAERVDFDSAAIKNDIDRAKAFLGYAARLNRLSYDLQGGYTWVRGDDSNNPIDVDNSDNDYSGPMFRASVNYLYQNHLFQVRAFRDLTDTSLGLGGSFSDGGYSTGDSSVTQLALVTRTQVDAYYNLAFSAEQWNWQIGYRYDQQDVEARVVTVDLSSRARDQKRDLIYSTLFYEMTPKINAGLIGSYKLTDFTDSLDGREDDIFRLALVFTFRIFKYGFVNLGAEQERRNTNGDLVRDYVDNKLFANLYLEYPVRPRERGARGGGGSYGSYGSYGSAGGAGGNLAF